MDGVESIASRAVMYIMREEEVIVSNASPCIYEGCDRSLLNRKQCYAK